MPSLIKQDTKARGRAAFTLVELLVVVLILGILLAVAIPLYRAAVKNAAVQTIKANMKTIATAAQAYKLHNGSYPADFPKYESSTALYANFIGRGKDLENLPKGPHGVYYRWATSRDNTASQAFSNPVESPAIPTGPGQFIIRVKEGDENVFGSSPTNTDSEAYLNLSTGGWGVF